MTELVIFLYYIVLPLEVCSIGCLLVSRRQIFNVMDSFFKVIEKFFFKVLLQRMCELRLNVEMKNSVWMVGRILKTALF